MEQSSARSWREEEELEVLELKEYIDAFRSSSDRARYVIFFITTVCLFILFGSWPATRWSSAYRDAQETRRIDAGREYDEKHPHPADDTPPPTDAEAMRERGEERERFIREKLVRGSRRRKTSSTVPGPSSCRNWVCRSTAKTLAISPV